MVVPEKIISLIKPVNYFLILIFSSENKFNFVLMNNHLELDRKFFLYIIKE